MRITKKQDYFVIQYSYKKDGKVKTKEKYLGKTISDNIENLKEEFLRQINGEYLFKKFDKIKENYQKNWKKFPLSVKEKARKEITIKFTYNTNAIEGSHITLDETKKLIEENIAPNKSLNDVQESKNHAKIFNEIMDNKFKELSLELVKQWHRDMFNESKPDMAGEIRDYLVKVGDYLCPDWQDLPELLKEFFSWYNKNKDKLHPIELAGATHYKFVKIHPFGDGNGRISRLIINFILNKNNFPPLIIEHKKRESYYRALNNADRKKSEWEFLKYIYRRYLNNYKEFIGDIK